MWKTLTFRRLVGAVILFVLLLFVFGFFNTQTEQERERAEKNELILDALLSDDINWNAIDVPAVDLPKGVKLTRIEKLSTTNYSDKLQYYVLEYQSNEVRFTYTEHTAAFQFNPADECLINFEQDRNDTIFSVSEDNYYETIPPGLECRKIVSDITTNEGKSFDVYKIDITDTFPDIVANKAPQYYITSYPQRYAINVLEGTMTTDDIEKLARSIRWLDASEIARQLESRDTE